MWKCPVCDKENNAEMVCPTCGYDRTCDYEQYPTVFAVTTATPTRTLRRQWQAKQGPGLIELVMRWFDAPQDLTAAERCFRRLADGGDPAAQWWLGTAYARGWGAKKDEAQAAQWFGQSARQGFADARQKLAELEAPDWYALYQQESDQAKRMEYLKKAAEQGYAPAQLELGGSFFLGEGVKKDPAQAIIWYRKAAEQGCAQAQYELGNRYCYGCSGFIKPDYAQAVKWYRKAAEQGYAPAQYDLGYHYYQGLGIERDYYQAAHWYRKAAEQGNKNAQRALADCYEQGRGVPGNPSLAREWREKAKSN